MSGERICIAGRIPGFRSMTDTTQVAPALDESAAQVSLLNRGQAIEQDQPRQGLRLT
jgi:hypothetical protein